MTLASKNSTAGVMQGLETVFRSLPVFKLRYTTMGDGGGLLSLTVHHSIVGGARIGHLQHDIARTCRGEPLEPLAAGLQRTLLSPESLTRVLPEHASILKAASTPRADQASFAEEWIRLYGSSLEELPPLPLGSKSTPRLFHFTCLDVPQ